MQSVRHSGEFLLCTICKKFFRWNLGNSIIKKSVYSKGLPTLSMPIQLLAENKITKHYAIWQRSNKFELKSVKKENQFTTILS